MAQVPIFPQTRRDPIRSSTSIQPCFGLPFFRLCLAFESFRPHQQQGTGATGYESSHKSQAQPEGESGLVGRLGFYVRSKTFQVLVESTPCLPTPESALASCVQTQACSRPIDTRRTSMGHTTLQLKR
ncbi:hypothetical protein CMEL01_06645 [Colletotrichum melonis]|uniref:Uncharacterized protein n=1 Tax=Colletotrichum melonis TaxID=1209925 RepID=A0AAI9U7X2_9PEZI|nr:hypothetical protein CMEL01_06645 [Colletotrichum melonis]